MLSYLCLKTKNLLLQFSLHKKPVLPEEPTKKTFLHFGFLQLQL